MSRFEGFGEGNEGSGMALDLRVARGDIVDIVLPYQQVMNQTTNEWQFLQLFRLCERGRTATSENRRLPSARKKGSKIPPCTPLVSSHVDVSRATAGGCLSINRPPTSCFFDIDNHHDAVQHDNPARQHSDITLIDFFIVLRTPSPILYTP